MNAVKEEAHRVIDALADNVEMEDVIEALIIKAKLAKADADIAAGRVVSHNEAKQRFEKWLK